MSDMQQTPKTAQIALRLTAGEKKQLAREAMRSGVSLSAWVRSLILRRAKHGEA